jgi:hypothetical protein
MRGDRIRIIPTPPARDTIVLISALLIVHIPLVFNGGLFGEDWLLFEVKPGYPTQTGFLIHGAGHPFLYAYCTLANFLGYPLAFMKALAMGGIALGAVSLRSFLVRLKVFSDFEATVFSFLVWSYAGYQNWATKLTATYIFSFALLCLGLALFALLAQSDYRRTSLRLCSLAAIFCSFSLNSMIAAYALGLSAVFLVDERVQHRGPRGLVVRSMKFTKRFGDFLAVPIVYWISVNHFFPKIGPYKAYYQLKFPDTVEAASRLNDFWQWGFYRLAWSAATLTRESRWPIILALAIGLGFVALVRNRPDNSRPKSIASVILLAATAVVSFVVCASPYIASGISPNGYFYESRHLLLFGLPLGLLLICVFRIVRMSSRSASLLFCAGALSVNLCALWSGDFLQQARWLRQESMIVSLKRDYREPPAAVFNLADGFLDYPGYTQFGLTEITGGLHTVWDGRPLFGFTGRAERPTILQEMQANMQMDGTAFRNMDIWGLQATIDFVPRAPVLTNYKLATSFYRCLLRLCEMQPMLDALADTRVRKGPIPNLAPHLLSQNAP